MPLPLVAVLPAAALASYAGYRALRRSGAAGFRDQKAEDALDELPEGVSLRPEPDSRNAAIHVTRVFQWRGGQRYELDLAAFGRIRLKRL